MTVLGVYLMTGSIAVLAITCALLHVRLARAELEIAYLKHRVTAIWNGGERVT